MLLDDDAHGVELEVPPKQERLTFPDALRLYPAALAWSVYFSLGVIMTAFDQQLLGSLFATPAFQRDFGYEYQPGQFTIKASWQTALTVCAPLGQAIGE